MKRKRKVAWRVAMLILLCLLTLSTVTALAQAPTATPQASPSNELNGQPTLDPCVYSDPDIGILSDIDGQNIDLYLKRVTYEIRQNWFSLIPEEAYLKIRGKVIVDTLIQKDGSITKIKVVCSSGDHALDRAAEVALRSSSPFPPLPEKLFADLAKKNLPIHLELRLNFYYNPGKTKPTPKPHWW